MPTFLMVARALIVPTMARLLPGVNVDLAAGTGTGGDAQGDTLSNIENPHRIKLCRYADGGCQCQSIERRQLMTMN